MENILKELKDQKEEINEKLDEANKKLDFQRDEAKEHSKRQELQIKELKDKIEEANKKQERLVKDRVINPSDQRKLARLVLLKHRRDNTRAKCLRRQSYR